MRKFLMLALAAVTTLAIAAGSEYYDHGTFPANGAQLSSSAMRAELDLIEAGFGKLPSLSGNGSKLVAVNSGGTALEAISAGVSSSLSATSGYQKFGTMIVQGALETMTGTTHATTFPLPFPTACIAVVGMDTGSNATITTTGNCTTTGVTFNASGAAGQFNWIAIGY